MSASLLVLGRDPSTALGSRLEGATPVGAVDDLDRAMRAATGPVGIVVGAAGDTLALTRAALDRGVPVLVEPVGRLPAGAIAELAASDRAYAGLRRRFESDVRWARGRVAAGGVGLTWAVHAESLASRAADHMTEALDLLDAATLLAGCAPVAVARFAGGRGAPATWVLTLEHAATGQLVVRMAHRRARRAGAPELASIRLLASHGLVAADLDGPLQRTHGRMGPTSEHVGADGADRVLAAFRGVVDGATGPKPVTFAAVAGIRGMLDGSIGRTG